jgi:large subunit ribosomal protein L35e
MLTVHNQQQKEGIGKAAAGSEYIDKDLRIKKNRACYAFCDLNIY